MRVRRGTSRPAGVVLALALAACAGTPTPPLSQSLLGISKDRFLQCAGPPVLEFTQGGMDRMSFVTNLNRGQWVGLTGPTSFQVQSCSVDAGFQNDRLVTAQFSGSEAVCTRVFAPCLQR